MGTMTPLGRERPLVSIVTPSLNHARFIRETIDSVLDQDYPHIEYIVIDGGSTDETISILESYGDALTWVSERDDGPADAINKGWARARGDVLHWLSSDDLLLPGAVTAAVEALSADGDAVGAYGSGLVIDEAGEIVNEWPVVLISRQEMLRVNNPLLQPAVFVTRDAADRAGPLDTSLDWVFDWDFFFRVVALGDLVRVDRELAVWREHAEARTMTGGLPRFWEVAKLLRRCDVPWSAPAFRLQALYGLLAWSRRVQATGPRLLRRPAADVETRAAQLVRKLRWIEVQPEGCYEDGWAPPHVRWCPRRGGSTLEIAGTVDTVLFPWLRGQSLQVVVDGTVLPERHALDDGPFELTIELPAPVDEHSVIEIRAAKSFVPARVRVNRDRRRLAYVLGTLRVS